MKVINVSVNEEVLMNGYQKFCYSFSKILLVILLFPFVYFYSKKYQKQFFKFCFTYQKKGNFKINNEQLVDFNSFEHHYYDCQIKELNKYGYPINWKQENYQEFIIKNDNNQDISCLTVIQKNKSKKWVIGFHGWTENKYRTSPHMYLWRKNELKWIQQNISNWKGLFEIYSKVESNKMYQVCFF